MSKRILTTFLMLAVSLPFWGFAQNTSKTVDHSFNGWYYHLGSYRIWKKWGLYDEIHIRRANVITDWQQFLFRPAIEYYLSEQTTLTAGYTLGRIWPYGKQPVPAIIPENGAWEQIFLRQPFKKFTLIHRYRLEQRWLGKPVSDGNGGFEIDGTNFQFRMRYRAHVMIPLVNFKSEVPRQLFLSLFDEAFLIMNKNVQVMRFDQNRWYAAIGYRFNPKVNLQIGMMGQSINKADGIHIENNPTLQVGLFSNLDFRNSQQ